MDLLDRIKQATEKGLTGLTIWPSSKGWQVSTRFDAGWYISTSKDIEEALLASLAAAKQLPTKKSSPPDDKKERRRQRRLERKKKCRHI